VDDVVLDAVAAVDDGSAVGTDIARDTKAFVTGVPAVNRHNAIVWNFIVNCISSTIFLFFQFNFLMMKVWKKAVK